MSEEEIERINEEIKELHKELIHEFREPEINRILENVISKCKHKFALISLIKIKDCVNILASKYNWNIKPELTLKPLGLKINLLNLPHIYFSIKCPYDLLEYEDGTIKNNGILAECMIVDDNTDKYYDRLDFGLGNESHNENTFYLHAYVDIRKILQKLLL